MRCVVWLMGAGLVACSPAPPASRTSDTTSTTTVRPSATPPRRTDTIYITRVVHDTVCRVGWTCTPPMTPVPPAPVPAPTPVPPAVGKGISIAAWHLPPDSTCGTVFNGTTLIGSSSMTSALDRIKACKGQTSVSVGRNVSLDANGLSAKAACNNIATWSDLEPSRLAGTLKVVLVADDIGNDFNGANPPYYARIDSIARCIKLRWPKLPTAVREECSGLSSGYSWRWLDNCWNQYAGPKHGDGTPAQYIATEEAAGKARGLGRIYGINGLDGGDGSSGILGTFPNAGSSSVNRWQMSAVEVKTALLTFAPYTCFLASWEHPASFVYSRPAAQLAAIKSFNRAEIRAAFAKGRAMADTLPARSCYVRP